MCPIHLKHRPNAFFDTLFQLLILFFKLVGHCISTLLVFNIRIESTSHSYMSHYVTVFLSLRAEINIKRVCRYNDCIEYFSHRIFRIIFWEKYFFLNYQITLEAFGSIKFLLAAPETVSSAMKPNLSTINK